MKNQDFTINFTCNVCGLPMDDSLTLNTKFWDETTGTKFTTGEHWSNGYVDFRHKECELEHGSFKEMVSEYLEKVSNDPVEAEDFVKQYRKKADFDREVDKEIKKKKIVL